jgi:hypothetical protein
VGLCANLAPKKITVLSWCTWLCFTSWEHQCARGGNSTHNPRGPPRPHRTDPAAATRTATGRWRARSTVLRAHTQRDPTDVSRTLVTRVFALSLFRICYLSGPGQFFFPTTTHTLSPKEHQLRMYAGLPRPRLCGARVQFIGRLEENRRNIQGLGCAFRIMNE